RHRRHDRIRRLTAAIAAQRFDVDAFMELRAIAAHAAETARLRVTRAGMLQPLRWRTTIRPGPVRGRPGQLQPHRREAERSDPRQEQQEAKPAHYRAFSIRPLQSPPLATACFCAKFPWFSANETFIRLFR